VRAAAGMTQSSTLIQSYEEKESSKVEYMQEEGIIVG
jgi:hypothetical protein